MSKELKSYHSVRLPMEAYQFLLRLKERQDLRIYESQPSGTTRAGGVTLGGLILMGLELVKQTMDEEDGIPKELDSK